MSAVYGRALWDVAFQIDCWIFCQLRVRTFVIGELPGPAPNQPCSTARWVQLPATGF